MRLIINNGIFYEFIPFNEDNFDADGELKHKPKTLLLNEVKANEPYAILLTTCSGAWRYLIGDVITFTNIEKCEIQIIGRTKHYLSLCGEHLSVDNMNRAIELVSDELNIDIPEFAVAGIPYHSLFAHKWYVGCDTYYDSENLKKLEQYASEHGIPMISVCGKMEMEIMELPEADRAEYLGGLGITETGRNKLLQAAYSACNLISFLTAGEDEVRAWTIHRGDVAPEAAGTIHSDFQQGFIRAEVVNFKDFVEAGGFTQAKQKGWVRLEGKEYVVQDGDIINFRFNV